MSWYGSPKYRRKFHVRSRKDMSRSLSANLVTLKNLRARGRARATRRRMNAVNLSTRRLACRRNVVRCPRTPINVLRNLEKKIVITYVANVSTRRSIRNGDTAGSARRVSRNGHSTAMTCELALRYASPTTPVSRPLTLVTPSWHGNLWVTATTSLWNAVSRRGTRIVSPTQHRCR